MSHYQSHETRVAAWLLARMLQTARGWKTLRSSLQARFAEAQQDVNRLPSRPDNDTMLKLYALYKQAAKLDATGDPPGGFDCVARAKFDTWSAVKAVSTEDAIEQYVDLVTSMPERLGEPGQKNSRSSGGQVVDRRKLTGASPLDLKRWPVEYETERAAKSL